LPDVKLCLDQYGASNAGRFLEAVPTADQLISAITVAEAKQLLLVWSKNSKLFGSKRIAGGGRNEHP
jgi:hypothetical protein